MRRFVLVLALAAVAIPTVWAQEGPSEETAQNLGVPAEFSSPRATMRTFLESFQGDGEPDLDRAATCLDLGALPAALRRVRGRELALDLKEVLDRTAYIQLDTLSEESDAAPWSLLVPGSGRVVLAPGEDGLWRFNRDTVERLNQLHQAVQSRQVVQGVTEVERPFTVSEWLRQQVPSGMRGRILFLETWQWLGLLILILLGVILDRMVVALLQGPVLRLLKRTFTSVDSELVHKSLKPAGALAMVVVWWIGIGWLGLPVTVLRWYGGLVEVVVILTAALTLYRMVDVFSDIFAKRAEATENRFDDLLVPLIRKSLKILIAAISLALVAETFDRDFTGLLAGLGLGGLAFALAAKDTAGNLFGSVTVLLDRPFQVGDWVKVGDVEGTVEELGFRSTRIRTFYNSKITLPNANLTNASVDNLGDRAYRRWSTRLGIAYATPPETIDAFCEGIRELIRTHPYTRKDYFHVYFNEFGADSLQILLYVFFVTPDWATELRERHRLAVDIMRLAAEMGVEFAFPTQTLFLRQESWEAPAGDPEGYDSGTRRRRRQARVAARSITEAFADGSRPGPVSFDPETARDGGEAEE
jgi:MscS family membrane protein